MGPQQCFGPSECPYGSKMNNANNTTRPLVFLSFAPGTNLTLGIIPILVDIALFSFVCVLIEFAQFYTEIMLNF